MTEAAIMARRAYKSEWQKRNREKVRQQQARYWERKAAAQENAEPPQQQREESSIDNS